MHTRVDETLDQKSGPKADHTSAPTDDAFMKSVEQYTARIPSSVLLAAAIGAIGLSLVGQLGGRGKWGNFIAQWAPTILILGVYKNLVKLERHNQEDRGQSGRSGGRASRPSSPASGISNRRLDDEQATQATLPPRGQARTAV
jgi:hypothetical protein